MQALLNIAFLQILQLDPKRSFTEQHGLCALVKLGNHLGKRFDFVVAGALKIIGFLCRTVRRIGALACVLDRAFGLLLFCFQRHQAIGQIANPVAAFFQPRLRITHFGALFLDVGLDHGQLFADRATARFGLRCGLRKFQRFHLQCMFAVLCLLNLAAQISQVVLCFSKCCFTFFLLRFKRMARFDLAGQFGLQRFDFALTLQHTVQFRLRTMQHQSVLAVKMPVRRHQQRTERQRFHSLARIGFVFEHKDIGQAFAHKRHYRRIIRRHPVRECGETDRSAGLRTAVFNKQHHASWWRIARGVIDDSCVRNLDRIELQAKRRFERVFPAMLDLDRLPQAGRVIQLIFSQPHRQTIVVVEPRLLVLQRQ